MAGRLAQNVMWLRNWPLRKSQLIIIGVLFIFSLGGCGEYFELNFPNSVELGDLWLIEDVNCFTCGAGEKHLGPAKGKHKIRLPASHWFVSLRMPKNASPLLQYLVDPSLKNLGDINLEGSNITDDDLKYIEGINLQYINLSKTKITGEGLKYLNPHKKWTWVYLEGCDHLNPSSLAHFRGWRRSTITVGKELLKAAKEIICDSREEQICGTQIR